MKTYVLKPNLTLPTLNRPVRLDKPDPAREALIHTLAPAPKPTRDPVRPVRRERCQWPRSISVLGTGWGSKISHRSSAVRRRRVGRSEKHAFPARHK